MSQGSEKGGEVLGGRRVLVIEDCDDHLLLYSNYLKLAGAQVAAACTEAEAYARLGEANYDAILIDVKITGVLSFELMSEIRKRGHRGALIAISIYDASAIQQKCFASGCTGFIQKPVLYRPFIQAIWADIQTTSDIQS
ncbi:MAG: response regulator [Bdellovibrionaceae bacterium]|nr:response regulator [Pseudobdellovibrionaceae bacterium]